MKVRDLIVQLSECDLDADVMVQDSFENYCDVHEAYSMLITDSAARLESGLEGKSGQTIAYILV